MTVLFMCSQCRGPTRRTDSRLCWTCRELKPPFDVTLDFLPPPERWVAEWLDEIGFAAALVLNDEAKHVPVDDSLDLARVAEFEFGGDMWPPNDALRERVTALIATMPADLRKTKQPRRWTFSPDTFVGVTRTVRVEVACVRVTLRAINGTVDHPAPIRRLTMNWGGSSA